MVMVGDATEDEAERLLLRALPIEWRRKVEVEVEKRNRDGVLMIEGLPSTLDHTQSWPLWPWRQEIHRSQWSGPPLASGK